MANKNKKQATELGVKVRVDKRMLLGFIFIIAVSLAVMFLWASPMKNARESSQAALSEAEAQNQEVTTELEKVDDPTDLSSVTRLKPPAQALDTLLPSIISPLTLTAELERLFISNGLEFSGSVSPATIEDPSGASYYEYSTTIETKNPDTVLRFLDEVAAASPNPSASKLPLITVHDVVVSYPSKRGEAVVTDPAAPPGSVPPPSSTGTVTSEATATVSFTLRIWSFASPTLSEKASGGTQESAPEIPTPSASTAP